ncbi:type II toxin-antitoxin system VapC family toxin [Desulfobacterales bacterium HSG17]|nr:type II toxin-antitoxin system VapC family toxin [Desulfobacterales bacterium HSG17]
MNLYCDTSAIIKLYYPEPESEKLSKWIIENKIVIPISLFHNVEINNAFALKLFRKEITKEQFNQLEKNLNKDISTGIITKIKINWSETLEKSVDLVKQYTENIGSRSLDIIHVASALTAGFKYFITFDDRQKNWQLKADWM